MNSNATRSSELHRFQLRKKSRSSRPRRKPRNAAKASGTTRRRRRGTFLATELFQSRSVRRFKASLRQRRSAPVGLQSEVERGDWNHAFRDERPARSAVHVVPFSFQTTRQLGDESEAKVGVVWTKRPDQTWSQGASNWDFLDHRAVGRNQGVDHRK